MSEDNDAGATPDDFVSLRPGQLVGRYRIASVLGQGGFGITYRATDTELGREVAIKEYLPAALAIRKDGTTVAARSTSTAADFAWGRDRFIAEGRTLAALHRVPGVVQVHDFLEANGTAYLVMELVRGRTLHEQVEQQGPLDAAALDRILWTLLDGLEQVHAAGFLHRDIKPANVLIDSQGGPILIDFGASRAAVAGRSQAMTAIFTPGYAAVEQFTAATQGPWTDIYGLAATVHHAIAGRAPPNAIDRIIDDTYEPLADSGLAFPRPLLAGIDAGLAPRAADRPQSIAAWRKLLSAASSGASAAAATVVMPRGDAVLVSATPLPRKRPAMMLAGGIAAVFLLAAGGWFALGSGSPSPAPTASTASPSTASASAAPPAAAPAPSAELEEARRAQQAALDEATRLRAEAEARRKSDEEAALRRQIAEEMRQKAEAEEAARRQAAEEAKRQAAAEMAAAAAARQQAESEARSKAEADAAARKAAEEADLKAAEAAETSLRLGQPDRQRIQSALTALGFPTGGTDGVFGARSREMIAAWQKKAGRAATGYLSADSQAALLREAGPLLAAAQPPPAAPPKAVTSCDGSYTAQWCRGAYQGFPPSCWNASTTISNGAISGGWTSPGSNERQSYSGNIDAGGGVTVTFNGIGQQTHVNQRFVANMTGRLEGKVLKFAGRGGTSGREFSATIQCR